MATTQKTKTRKSTEKNENAILMATHGTENTVTGMHELVARRAYEIWQASGCPQGRNEEHWYQAERELTPATKASKSN